MPRSVLAFLSAVGGALLLTACDSATSPTATLRPTSSVSADRVSNDDKDACKKGGFANYTRADGSTFSNQGECVSYVEHGGKLLPKAPPPTISSFTGVEATACDANGAASDVVQLTAVFTGGPGTITGPSGVTTPVTSGVQVTLPFIPGTYTLTVTNAAGTATSSVALSSSGGVGQCGGGGPGDFNRGPRRGGMIGAG